MAWIGTAEEKPRWLDPRVPEGRVEVEEADEEEGGGEMWLRGFAHPCIPKDRNIHPAARSLRVLRRFGIFKLKKKKAGREKGKEKRKSEKFPFEWELSRVATSAASH